MTVKEKDYNIYLVPHTHYDSVWVFTEEDYYYINIDLILKKVVELLEKTDDYKFTIEQTYLLEEVEKRFPELFMKIKKYVKEGRIEIADGEYLMADTMLPQEETLIREILVGKKYVEDKFGVDVPVMWQADSFGLNAQLPQIYKKSGYKYVAFRRGCPDKKNSEFLWEGLDGTRIISHFMPLGYRAGLDLTKLEQSYRELKPLASSNHILMPSGSGVMMPQPETSWAVKKWNEKHKSKMKIATPSEFFNAIEKYNKKLPVKRGEMYSGRFSEVFPDCCSSRIWIKMNLRKYENLLLAFERFLSALFVVNRGHAEQYMEELNYLWKKILFLGFHDVVPGTGMDRSYDETRSYLEFLETKLSYLMPRVLCKLMECDSGKKMDCGDIVVFNPFSGDVSNWVEIDLNFEHGKIRKIAGLRNGNEEIDVEVLRFARYEDEFLKSARIGFVANVPAMGYKIYKIIERKPKTRNKDFIRIRGNTIETRFLKVRFYPDTGLVDIIKNGKKICKANELIIEEEIGDLYFHKENHGNLIKTESGDGIKYGSFRVKNFRIDKSPLRRVINVETDYFSLRWPYRLTDKLKPMIWRHNFLSISKKIIVYKNLPRVDFITTVKNNHPRIRLRVKFSTDIKSQNYHCETQFGTVSRQTDQYYSNQEGWYEKPSGIFPSLRWIDYNNGKVGLTIINKGTPENEVRDGNIYITLLRAVDMLSCDGKAGPLIPVPDARETKRYVFNYSAYPHEGGWEKAKSYVQGYGFNFGIIPLQIPRAKKFNVKRSFIKLEPENIVSTAFKPSEDGKSVVLRFYEASGKKTTAKITFFRELERAVKTNLLEEELEEVPVNKNCIKLNIKPFEIVTLKLFCKVL